MKVVRVFVLYLVLGLGTMAAGQAHSKAEAILRSAPMSDPGDVSDEELLSVLRYSKSLDARFWAVFYAAERKSPACRSAVIGGLSDPSKRVKVASLAYAEKILRKLTPQERDACVLSIERLMLHSEDRAVAYLAVKLATSMADPRFIPALHIVVTSSPPSWADIKKSAQSLLNTLHRGPNPEGTP